MITAPTKPRETTVANLFYNMGRKTVGLVGMWDCVAFDEVAGINFKDKDGIQIMKDYMASGSFARGKEEKAATASKQTRILVQQHLGTLTQSTGGAERGYPGLIGLPVGQLLLDLRHRALAAVAEPGGELGGTFLAQIAVLQLAVAQQPDLAAADRAFLFIK